MPLLKKDIRNNILMLTLSDPESRNAFSPPVAEEFHQAVSTQSYSGLLLMSEGPVFCSGGNLPFYKNLKSKEEGLTHNRRITEILNSFESLPIPKACLVDGLCVGGGVELAACFDKVFGSPHSLFGLWQRRVGLSFGWGGQKRLLQKLSKKDLTNWLLEAGTLSSYQAQELGLVDEILLSSKMENHALDWFEKIEVRGEISRQSILEKMESPEEAFESLWLNKEHRQALDKIKP